VNDLSPDDIQKHRFSTSFRGFDTAEVRAYLVLLAEQISGYRQRVVDLEQQIQAVGAESVSTTDARTDADAVDGSHIEAVAAPTAASDPTNSSASESHQVPPQTGTAEVVAATNIAADIVAKARADAADIVSRANDEAARITLRARVESRDKLLRSTGSAGSTGSTGSNMSGADQPDRGDMTDTSNVRDEARAMVLEAKAVRERILTDLAKRRKVAQVQLEQLRAAREKLLESLRDARRMVDDASRDLSTAEVEARVAADMAGRRMAADTVPSAAELEVELVAARHFAVAVLDATLPVSGHVGMPTAGHVDASQSVASDSRSLETSTRLSAAQRLADPRPAPATERAVRADSPFTGEFAAVPGVQARLSTSASATAPATAPTKDEPTKDEPTKDEPTKDESSEHVSAKDEPGQTESSEAESGASERGDSPSVDELFARLRKERELAAAVARTVLDEVSALSEAVQTARVAGVPTVVDLRDSDVAISDSPDSIVEEAVSRVAARDEALRPLEHRVSRAVKRALQDEQSAVLEALRTTRGKVDPKTLLPDESAHHAVYAMLVIDAVGDAAQLGAQAVNGRATGIHGNEAELFAAAMCDNIRSAVTAATAQHQSVEADSAALTELINACYREWRTERAASGVSHALAEAYSRGLFDAVPSGTDMRWVHDNGSLPCPECDNNVLGGPVVKGTPFATSHLRAPAHQGCRCLVVPAPRR
jgi:DivIVA domain-containing protein